MYLHQKHIKLLSTILLSVLILSCSSEEEPTQTFPDPTPAPDPSPTFTLPTIEDCGFTANVDSLSDWTLIFEDNFDSDVATNWAAWRGGAFNNELQHYQASNLYVENSYLYIQGKRQNVNGRTNPFDQTNKSFTFSSGRIESKQEFGPNVNEGQQNVRLSARIKLVEGDGLWPAWWSYNDPWPTKGEIDILEARGNTPFEFQSNFHFGINENQIQTNPAFNESVFTHTEKLSECFHLYELVWSRDSFSIIFDGEVVKEYDQLTYEYVDDFFGKKHRLVLNLAIGGDFFANLINNQIPNESFMVVDWVRVYQK